MEDETPRQVVKRVRERDLKFKGRGGTKRKHVHSDIKERAEFVKRRRQLGYDADAKLGLSAL